MGLSKADKIMLLKIEKGLRIERDGTVIGIWGRPIKGSLHSRGKKNKNTRRYLVSKYRYGGTQVTVYFHRLQAYTKFGDALFEDGVVTRHGKGGPLDNSWDNINIGTQATNMKDIPAKERRRSGLKRAKVSDEQILEMRAMRKEGISPFIVAEKYGVDRFTVWRLCRDLPLSETRKTR